MLRSLARAAVVVVSAGALLLGGAVPGVAAPPAAATGDTAVLASWPAELQQLVAGTQAFAAAPWFTNDGCAARGGDVALYINTFFQREKAFRAQLISDFIKGHPKLQELGAEPTVPADDEVFPNGDAAYDVAHDTCAVDLAAWTTPDASSPWGFRWAARPDAASLEQMATNGGDVDPLTVCTDDPTSYLCSRAFFVNCDQATTTDQQRCIDWNFSVQQHLNGMQRWIEANTSVLDRVGEFFGMVGGGLWAAGAWVVSALGWVAGKVGEFFGWVAKKGMEQVVAFFTEGAVWLWGQVTAWMVNFTTPNVASGGFVTTYNLISGVMLAMAFLIWLAGLVTAWRRGRLTGSIVGAVKAVMGIQLVGVIAYLMLMLANEATLGIIAGHQQTIMSADFTVSLLQVNPAIGLVAAMLTILGLLGAGIVLIFQAPLTLGHALFGTVAAAGQAHHASDHWFGRWFVKLLSLAWCKFFIVGMTILGQNLLTSTTANMQQNVGQQLFAVLAGSLLMLLLPTTPWLLSAMMSFTVGHASAAADRMSQGMTAAVAAKAGGAALAAAAPVAGAAGAALSAAAGNAVATPLATMASNLAALGALNGGTFGAGAGGTTGAGGSGPAARLPGARTATGPTGDDSGSGEPVTSGTDSSATGDDSDDPGHDSASAGPENEMDTGGASAGSAGSGTTDQRPGRGGAVTPTAGTSSVNGATGGTRGARNGAAPATTPPPGRWGGPAAAPPDSGRATGTTAGAAPRTGARSSAATSAVAAPPLGPGPSAASAPSPSSGSPNGGVSPGGAASGAEPAGRATPAPAGGGDQPAPAAVSAVASAPNSTAGTAAPYSAPAVATDGAAGGATPTAASAGSGSAPAAVEAPASTPPQSAPPPPAPMVSSPPPPVAPRQPGRRRPQPT